MNSNILLTKENKQTFSEPFQSCDWFVVVTLIVKHLRWSVLKNSSFLYTGYADGTTFFVKNQTSVIEILEDFDKFSKISGVKPNKSKCEIAENHAL